MNDKLIRMKILAPMMILFGMILGIHSVAWGQSAAVANDAVKSDTLYAVPSIQKGTISDAINYSYDNPDVVVVHMAVLPDEGNPATAGQYAARLVALAQKEGLEDIVVFCETSGNPNQPTMIGYVDGLTVKLEEDHSGIYDPSTFVRWGGFRMATKMLLKVASQN